MKDNEINWLKKIWEALCNIAPSPEAVQSNWTENDNTKPTYIKNKPTIPEAQIQSDWNQADSSKKDFIKNKPGIILRVEVADITAIPAETLNALSCGDQVVKSDVSGKHAYLVSYKGDGGLSLSYFDCDNVETVAYTKTGDVWAYDDTTVTHIGV